MTKDPVCGMDVKEQTTPHTSTYHGKVYAFCGAGWKASFEKAPETVSSRNPNNPNASEPGWSSV